MKRKIIAIFTMVSMIIGTCCMTTLADGLKQQRNNTCKATAVAEMINRATGTKYTEKDFYSDKSGLCASIQGKKFDKFTGEYKTDYSKTSKKTQSDKIDESLSRNVPIVVQVSPGQPHHWVTILRKDNNTYWICDPADGKEKRLDSKYTLGAHNDYGYVALNGSSINPSPVIPKLVPKSPPIISITYYQKYTGSSNSIVIALNSIKVDSSYNNRFNIAKINNISNYSGTATQNIQMLNLLKNGKLIKSIK